VALNSVQLHTTQTKSEPTSPEVRTLKRKKPINNETSSSDDDAPLASSPFKTKSTVIPSGAAATASVHKKGHHKASTAQVSNTDDDCVKDESLGTKLKRAVGKTNGKAKRPPKKKAKQEESDSDLGSDDEADRLPSQKRTGKHMAKMEDSDLEDEDKPITEKAVKHPRKKKAKKEEKEEDASGSDTSKLKKKPAKAKKEKDSEIRSPKKAKSKKQKEEEEAEDVFKWWEAQEAEGDGTIKWQTLEHNGVLFPPPYESLPREIKMRYNGIPDLLF
jgi:DNA topoisomerase-1